MGAPEHGPVVECRDLVVDYRTASGVHRALHGIDLDVPARRLTVVAGPSGSGKSSLLRVLAGLHRPVSGAVRVAGTDLVGLGERRLRRLRRHGMGVVLQNPIDNLVDALPAREQVALAARLRGAPDDDGVELLALLGLEDRLDATPAQLSGGEQQRVAFAAAAVGDPPLVLADEPTAQLDAVSAATVVEAMRALAVRGVTLVASSHDPAVIAAGQHVVRLHAGRVEAP